MIGAAVLCPGVCGDDGLAVVSRMVLLALAILAGGCRAELPRLSVPGGRALAPEPSDPGTGGDAQPRFSIGIGTGGYRGAGQVDFTPRPRGRHAIPR